MVKTTLTPELIEAGERFLRKLDERGVRPDAAFWLYSRDLDGWKLVVAEVNLGKDGPQRIYKRFQKVLAGLAGEGFIIALNDLTLAKPDAPIVSLLKGAVRASPGASGVRLRNSGIDGTFIEDAYVYRVA